MEDIKATFQKDDHLERRREIFPDIHARYNAVQNWSGMLQAEEDLEYTSFDGLEDDDQGSGITLYPFREPFHKETKTGRNDPCPCGSGKKYKKCCMDRELGAKS